MRANAEVTLAENRVAWGAALPASRIATAISPARSLFSWPTLLEETCVPGANSKWQVIRPDLSDAREWLARAVICPELARHRIAHLGLADVASPFQVTPLKQSGSAFLACFGGEGRVLVQGRWQPLRAGMACWLPPGILAAFQAVPEVRWQFGWVCYGSTAEKTPFSAFDSAMLERFGGEAFRLAITGLFQACAESPVPSTIHHWLELIQTYVHHFIGPAPHDERLLKLWTCVEDNLSLPWTGEKLACHAHVCFEHLRRLCHRQLGRSPMHQVIFLRMRRAAELLARTDEKVESVASAVGYSNPFAFSVAFKRWMGWPRSEFRRKSRERQSVSHGYPLHCAVA